MVRQPRLFTFHLEDRSAATLLLSPSNRGAWDELERWKDWPFGVMVLTGPPGAGKTHMGLAWAERARAGIWYDADRGMDVFDRFGGKMVVDNADRYPDEPHLALLLDAARTRPGAAVLLIAQDLPERWPVRLKDLRSRLVAAPQVRLGEPDDVLLAGVLHRLCRAKFIKLTDKACNYLLSHMERSFAAAQAVADALDQLHVNGSRPVSVSLAVKALRIVGGETIDPSDGDGERDPLAEEA